MWTVELKGRALWDANPLAFNLLEEMKLFCGERSLKVGVSSQEEALGNSCFPKDSIFLLEFQFETGLSFTEEKSEKLLVFSWRAFCLTDV